MKTHRAQFGQLTTVAALACALLCAACGGGGGGTPAPNIPPLTITGAAYLADGVMGQPYSQTLTATGGTPPYVWSLSATSAPLPPGLALSSEGIISGAPSTTGDFDFGIQVRDSAARTAKRDYRITVRYPLQITTSSLPPGNVALPYSGWLFITGGTSPYTWSLVSGSLPGGLTLTPAGGIQGTPTEPGTFSFTVQVTDGSRPPQTANRTVGLLIGTNVGILTSTLPLGVVGRPYHATVQAAGGTPPYSWSLPRGTFPQGLTLNASTGEISGTPTEAPVSPYYLFHVTDSSTPPTSAEAVFQLPINPPLQFRTSRLPDGVLGRTYRGEVWVQGGIPPFTLRLVAGNLPPGMTIDPSSPQWGQFAITGPASSLGTVSFTLEAADSDSPPYSITTDFSIRINEPFVVTTTGLPDGMTSVPYAATLQATGGIPPYDWELWTSTPLPAGLTLNSSTGGITGTPTQAFYGPLTFWARDSSEPPQQQTPVFWLRIIGRLEITSSRLPAGRPNAPYRITLGLFGGTAPYAWSITSGTLPNGLSLNSGTGEITGTPTVEGTSNFTVHVTDTGPPVQTATRDLSLTIKNNLGRNDSIATATPISNGKFHASLSPYSDPVDGPAVPDSDYYQLSAMPGSVVTIETVADRLSPPSPMDSVVEIVDSAGNRLSTCRPGGDTYGYFSQPCLNDDFDWYNTLDSKLYFRAPDTLGTPVTFYVHVLDWSGSARPDFIYDLSIFGAN
jgi:hypothetical protein